MNYFKLDLPVNPIQKNFKLQFNGDDFWHVYTNVDAVLDETILSKFIVRPSLVVIFAAQNSKRTNAFLHTDLTWYNNTWHKVPCSINWELQPVSTTIRWYDTNELHEIWPNNTQAHYDYPLNLLNGISYMNSENYVLLQELEVDNSFPILFRTDTAHALTYISGTTSRFMCSVRFSLDDIPTWDHAVEIFQKLIVDSN